MPTSHLASYVEYAVAMGYNGAGTGDTIDGTGIDVKVQESDDNSTYTDVSGSSTAVTDADDNKLVKISVRRPKFKKRYARVHVTRATANSTVNAATAIVWDQADSPPDTDAVAAGVTKV